MKTIDSTSIQETLKTNFTDFAADLLPNNLPSVCDGLVAVQRKVIYALYNNGVTQDKPYKKMLMCSAMAMTYYVFGDIPLTDAMKNMGSNALAYKYLDPKGSYPNKNRKDGVGASPRYIECRLTEYSEDLLSGIRKNNVPILANWDESTTEPVYLPSPIPNMLVNNSQSIAVGFSSKFPSHNLIEVCDAFINYLETGDITSSIHMIKGCDSPLGANIIYDETEIEKIMTTGRGSYQMICTWEYDKKQNKIVITEIPCDTYIEDIDEKIRLYMDKGYFKEIIKVHDGSDKDGLKYDIYLKKNANVDVVISKLRKYTPFQSSVPVWFYMLKPDGITPHLYNLKEIIEEWFAHRILCIKRELVFDIEQMEVRLNRMEGFLKLLENLDAAQKTIREAKTEKIIRNNLAKQFDLNEEQTDYISSIKFINLNKDWISKQVKEYKTIAKKIHDAKKILENEKKIKQLIIQQLEDAKQKYGQPRRTKVLYDVEKNIQIDIISDHNCYLVCTKQGYVKKVIRFSDSQKIKDGDSIVMTKQVTNKSNLLIFTNKANLYTVKISTLDETVPSSLGQYIPALLNFEQDEEPIFYMHTATYLENLVFVFENGKVARIKLKSYCTSLKKMTKVFNTDSKLVTMFIEDDKYDYITLDSADKKRVCYMYKDIRVQNLRYSRGVTVMKLKENDHVVSCYQILDEHYLLQNAGYGKSIK